jgi:hypothetical protein
VEKSRVAEVAKRAEERFALRQAAAAKAEAERQRQQAAAAGGRGEDDDEEEDGAGQRGVADLSRLKVSRPESA